MKSLSTVLIFRLTDIVGAVYLDFSWKNKIRMLCSQCTMQNYNQREEMISTEKEDKAQYDHLFNFRVVFYTQL